MELLYKVHGTVPLKLLICINPNHSEKDFESHLMEIGWKSIRLNPRLLIRMNPNLFDTDLHWARLKIFFGLARNRIQFESFFRGVYSDWIKMNINHKVFKEFENLSVEKKTPRLRWDSSPGLSIAEVQNKTWNFK